MPRITKVYTRTGDQGETSLATGARVAKTSPRIRAFGAVDELNSCLGVALALELEDAIQRALQRIQNELFHLGSDLCVPEADKQQMPVPVIEDGHVEPLEQHLDEWSEALPPLQNFILPGGTKAAAALHQARAVCRRAECDVLALAEGEEINARVVVYLNRLSDLLFVAARRQNAAEGASDVLWDSRTTPQANGTAG